MSDIDFSMMKCIFFGTGSACQKILQVFTENVHYYVDNNKENWDKIINGKVVYNPNILLNEKKEEIIIIVASSYYEDIAKQLKIMGFIENVHFINGLKYFDIVTPQTGYIPVSNKELFLKKSIDSSGRVLIDFNNKKVYRGIFSKYSKTYRKIFDKCLSSGLFGKYIVNTSLSKEEIRPFGLVFEHEYVDPVIYPPEWSSLMFKTAAQMVLDFMIELDKYNLGIKDSHPYNVMFNKGVFQWSDFGSIILGKTKASAINQFMRTFINPLIYMSNERYDKAIDNLLTTEYRDIEGYLADNQKILYREILYIINHLGEDPLDDCFNHIQKLLDTIVLRHQTTTWTHYQTKYFSNLEVRENWNEKQKQIMEFIERRKPQRILDLAGNQGWFCFAAGKLGIKSILTDIAFECIDMAFGKILQENNQYVTPAVSNFITPLCTCFKARPIENDGCIIPTSFSAKSRFQSDMVLALALVHHLVFYQSLTFNEIARQLRSYTNKYLVVEFVQPTDYHVAQWFNDSFNWYQLDNFTDELKKYFRIIKITESSHENRVLVFGETLD